MSGAEHEAKHEAKMVSIPLSSDDEVTSGGFYRNSSPSHHMERGDNVTVSGNVDEEDAEEKARIISEVLELQNTLDDLSQRVDAIKDENLKLKSENQVLGQYIENLMSASSVFQPTNTGSKKRQGTSKSASKKGEKR
ncbi:short coiled-coil protein B [Nematostella vectensis]|uniref:short coiled-coil protein B n=1 Tax=Nematostella vectensis TaxID=45351 RepID=UPI002076F011|nr:short coiled-coil protein B [Nematostella vectensis]